MTQKTRLTRLTSRRARSVNRTVLQSVLVLGLASSSLMCSRDEDDSPPLPPMSTGGGNNEGGMGGMGTLDPCEDVFCPTGAVCRAEGMSAACVCESEACEGIPLCGPDSCAQDATCTQMEDGFTCSCKEGFSGNGFVCVEGDLCDDFSCPGDNSVCVTDGTVAACACRPGFEPSGGGNCTDIDECEGTSPCGVGATCLNQPGSYVCDCASGYETQNNGTCTLAGGCAGSTACEDLGMQCLGVPGEVSCVCSGSQLGDGTFCKATPDCDGNSCENGGTCLEKATGFACACPRGTTGEFCENTSACSLSTVLNAASNPVIEDPTLRRVLENAAGVFDGSAITVGDLNAVDEIYVASLEMGETKIASLAGLECLQSLLYLTLYNQNVSNLTPLLHHNSLISVDLSCNPLTSLAPLAGKSSIRELYVDINDSCTGSPAPLSNMTHVVTLKNLRTLSVVGQSISSDPGFDDLPYLNYLNIAGNSLNVLSALGTMASLEYLDARGSGASSLSGLSNFPLLRELNVSGSNVGSLSGIGSALHLRTLVALDLGLTSLAGVGNADVLREIRVNGNEITSLAPLAASSSLIRARLIDNKVESLADFAAADPLNFSGTIDLNTNPLDCEDLAEIEADLNAQNIFINSDCSGF